MTNEEVADRAAQVVEQGLKSVNLSYAQVVERVRQQVLKDLNWRDVDREHERLRV